MRSCISAILLIVLFCSCSSDIEGHAYTKSSSKSNDVQSVQFESSNDPDSFDLLDDSIIGVWKGDWYKGDRIELVLNSGIYFRRNYYTIDTIVSYELEIRDTNGILSYVNKDEPSLEYYRIEDNGNLGRYSKWLKVEEIEKLDQK